jgi:hypothetical protein
MSRVLLGSPVLTNGRNLAMALLSMIAPNRSHRPFGAAVVVYLAIIVASLSPVLKAGSPVPPPPPPPNEVPLDGGDERDDLAVATEVPGHPGFVYSPYAPDLGWVDVQGYLSGAQVICPYTGKVFIVP